MGSKRNRVFISYRNDDSGSTAELLRDKLVDLLGEELVFYAPRDIDFGDEFATTLQDELDRAAVIVVLIGKRWFEPEPPYNIRRIDRKDDWVRKEIAYGLAHSKEVKVITFLLEGAAFPSDPATASKVLPADLQLLADLHHLKSEIEHRIPDTLLSRIQRALREAGVPVPKKVSGNRSLPPMNQLSHLTVVLHGGYQRLKPTQAAAKRELIEFLKQGLPKAVSEHSPQTFSTELRCLSTSELLTCQAGVVVIDHESLQNNDYVASQCRILGWRKALGMPLVTILLNGLRRADLRGTPLDPFRDYFVIDDSPKRTQAKTPQSMALDSVKALEEMNLSRGNTMYSDPATMWANDVTEIVAELGENKLLVLAEQLKIPPAARERAEDLRRVIAATLFETDLVSAMNFLRHAVASIKERGISRERSNALVSRTVPIWVDLDAGRTIVSSTQAPTNRRLCGLRLSDLEWAEHATIRATANALIYPTVRLSSVGGEDIVTELIPRHDATLRSCLNLGKKASPKEIKDLLKSENAAVFAILGADTLKYRELDRVIRELCKRFPGITFVLVSDQNHKWSFSPPVKVAIEAMNEQSKQRVSHFILSAKKLISEDGSPNAE